MRQILSTALAIATALGLGGCASVPTQLAGTNFAAITPQQAAQQNAQGDHVRWGGSIVKVEPKSDHTCFEILSRELYADARPSQRSRSDGRFIACGKGFYDPELYKKNRDITVTGVVAGTVQHKVGDYDYTYAKVDADNVYLWPQRVRTDARAWPYYYDPFWGPWGPYWGWGGWWAPPVVIVRPAPPAH